jgi:putative solute:sodium symporter small subunit
MAAPADKGRAAARKKKQAVRQPSRRTDMQLSERHKEYWSKNVRITAILLGIWFVVTYVVGYFSRELSGITILGFPFPFYMAAQGALIIYVVIIFYYARYMNRLDKEYDVAEED